MVFEDLSGIQPELRWLAGLTVPTKPDLNVSSNDTSLKHILPPFSDIRAGCGPPKECHFPATRLPQEKVHASHVTAALQMRAGIHERLPAAPALSHIWGSRYRI